MSAVGKETLLTRFFAVAIGPRSNEAIRRAYESLIHHYQGHLAETAEVANRSTGSVPPERSQ